MASRNKIPHDNPQDDRHLLDEVVPQSVVEPSVEEEMSPLASNPPSSYNSEEDVVILVSRIDTELHVEGASGRMYIWPRAGSKIPVLASDAPSLLTKKLHNSPCCGGGNYPDANLLFELG